MRFEAVTDIDQIEIIEGLADEIWHEYFTAIIGKAQVDYMLEKFQSRDAMSKQIKNGFLYFLIKHDNRYAGYIAVQPKGPLMFLSKLYILSTERGKGLGRKAIRFVGQLAIEKGASKISLTVNRYNSATIAAYKRLGFDVTEEIVQDIGGGFVMDDYRMEKKVGIQSVTDG